MTASRNGIAVLGEPLALAAEAALVEIWRARCETGATGDYVSADPRLFIVMEPLQAEIALDDGSGGRSASRLRSASFVPAGVGLRLRAVGATEMRHLDLHFDPERLGPIDGFDEASAAVPRLMFADERVQRFARLLEGVCSEAPPAGRLYGEALLAGLLAAAFARPGREPRRSALSERQTRASVDYIEERCAEPIRLSDLAALTGLSASYFSHAFKAATGAPPHLWQLQARIRRAKRMLAETDAPLTEVAIATGFSDQPHFSRVFKRVAGGTPSAWRQARRAPTR